MLSSSPHLLSQLWSGAAALRSTGSCHKWHSAGVELPVVNSDAGSSVVGCGRGTRGRGPAIKRGQRHSAGREGSRGNGLECNSISEASVLFVDVESGNLSAIFLAAAISSDSAPTPTLLFTFCQTHVGLSVTRLDSCSKESRLDVRCHAALNHRRQCTYCKHHQITNQGRIYSWLTSHLSNTSAMELQFLVLLHAGSLTLVYWNAILNVISINMHYRWCNDCLHAFYMSLIHLRVPRAQLSPGFWMPLDFGRYNAFTLLFFFLCQILCQIKFHSPE